MDSKRALADNVGKNIYEMGMTHAKYAKEIGTPVSTLEYVISGKNSISMNTLDRIARGTGIDPWELIKPQGV